MIIVIGPDATEEQKKAVRDKIIELDYTPHEIVGVERQVIGAVGEDHGKDHLMEVLESMAGVESVIPILKPYKLAGREIKSANSEVNCGGVIVGGPQKAATRYAPPPKPLRKPVLIFCEVAPSNLGLRPTVSRDSKKKASKC